MKTKLIALAAFTALANPAMAQETLIGPGVNNGDIEDGVAAPFAGVVGVASMAENHSAGGQYSVEIDLTANNGYQKWKALSDNPVITITDDTLNINHSVWVYIPMSATIANDCVLGLDIEYDDGTGFVTNKKIPGAYVGLNLQTAAKGVWHEVGVSDVDIPDNTIAVRTRPYNISTVDLVNGVDATAAAPADWVAAGYNGFLYLDDYSMTTTTPPDPSIIIQGDVANGNLENTTLAPWNPEGGAGSVDTLIFNGGAQSMSIDMAAPGKASRWRNMRNNRTAPAVAGDVIGTSIWFFIPSTTTFGTPTAKAIFNAELRSDRNMDATPGNGNLAGQLSVDLTSLPTDQWVRSPN